MAQERHGEKTVEAPGPLAQTDFEFVVHLVMLRELFGETKLLSDMLQLPTVDLSRAVDLGNALVQTLKDYRQESFFAMRCCNTASGKTSKKSWAPDSVATAHCWIDGGRTDKDMFLTLFFYPVIDSMLNELKRRFSNTNCELMKSIQSLSTQSDAFLKDSTVFSFGRLYNANIDNLGHELHLFNWILDRKIQRGEIQKPCSTVKLICFTEPYREVFFEFGSCDHSFSTLKLIKTHLRSTTTDERLSDLGVLSIESRRKGQEKRIRFWSWISEWALSPMDNLCSCVTSQLKKKKKKKFDRWPDYWLLIRSYWSISSCPSW